MPDNNNEEYEYFEEPEENNTNNQASVDPCFEKEKKIIKTPNRIIIFSTCDGNRRYDEVNHILMPIYEYLKNELGMYDKTFLFIGNLLPARKEDADLKILGKEVIDKIIKENKDNHAKFKANGELNTELSNRGNITIFHADDTVWNLNTVKSQITKDTAIFLFGHGAQDIMSRKENVNYEKSSFPTTGREYIDREYLYTLANGLSSNQIVTAVNMCYGGLFIDNIKYVPKNLHVFTNNECTTAGLDSNNTTKFLGLFDSASDPKKFMKIALDNRLKLSSHYPCSYIYKRFDGGLRKKYRKTRNKRTKRNKKRKSLKRK